MLIAGTSHGFEQFDNKDQLLQSHALPKSLISPPTFNRVSDADLAAHSEMPSQETKDNLLQSPVPRSLGLGLDEGSDNKCGAQFKKRELGLCVQDLNDPLHRRHNDLDLATRKAGLAAVWWNSKTIMNSKFGPWMSSAWCNIDIQIMRHLFKSISNVSFAIVLQSMPEHACVMVVSIRFFYRTANYAARMEASATWSPLICNRSCVADFHNDYI
jgi:hypothetical protein